MSKFRYKWGAQKKRKKKRKKKTNETVSKYTKISKFLASKERSSSNFGELMIN